MSRLKWDQKGDKKWETGVSNGVLYVSGANGYGAGVAWNGLTAITESPSGADNSDFYADNIKYATLRAAEEFGGTIEAFTYPDEWEACDGSATVAGAVTLGQQKRAVFGLSYLTRVGNDQEGDQYGEKIHLIYGATASPSERSYQTVNDSPELITFSWEFTTVPENVGTIDNVDYNPVACITIDSTKLEGSVNNQKFKDFKDIIWGKDGAEGTATEAELPSPAEVYAYFA